MFATCVFFSRRVLVWDRREEFNVDAVFDGARRRASPSYPQLLFFNYFHRPPCDLNRFKIKHEGPEEYNNMWQKSRAIWKYINFHYINDFDWFVLGGDDLFVIVENLRKVGGGRVQCS